MILHKPNFLTDKVKARFALFPTWIAKDKVYIWLQRYYVTYRLIARGVKHKPRWAKLHQFTSINRLKLVTPMSYGTTQ